MAFARRWRRRFGRRRRRYRKRRYGWRRRYYRYRPRYYRRRWLVRRRRRSVYRRGGRRARPYRISAFNPKVMRRVVIRGWWPILQCLKGQESLRYRPLQWDVEKSWKINTALEDNYGYLVQYGGGWGSGEVTLEGLYQEHLLWRNSWSKGNDGMDLVRYFGCIVYLYPLKDQDYWFWWDTDFKELYAESIKEYSQPSVMMMAKRTKIVIARSRAPHRRKVRRIFIPPPSRDTTQWQFQTDFCNRPLFTWAAGLIDLQKPFDANGAFRNAWWLEQRNEAGEMKYIELWGRVPPQGDTELPLQTEFQKPSGYNPKYYVNPGEEKPIYPVIIYVDMKDQKPRKKYCVCYNKTLNRWRSAQASTLKIGDLQGLVLRQLMNQEMTYTWKEGEFTNVFLQRWRGFRLAVIDARKADTENPTVQTWKVDGQWNTQGTVLKEVFNINLNNEQMRQADFGKLNLPKSPHDIDFGRHSRFGPFCVKNEPLEFQLTAPEPTNLWFQYKFLFQFGGEYQPPTGIRDPCADNPAYPVPQSGSITHPKFAGKGGMLTETDRWGITAASSRALSADTPTEATQSALLRGDSEKKGEETEETSSSSSITSAESSTEGDGSSDDEETIRRRRRTWKRLRRMVREQLDRRMDHKRQRLH
uniref:Capsid protein n=1 Tax=Torque teno sus virus 1b TaxID=687387 RepID=A0A344X425_9VIRU|nr:ORF1 [Torque teno sus virus 1b]